MRPWECPQTDTQDRLTNRRKPRYFISWPTLYFRRLFHHSVWSVITAHKLTAVKRDVTTVVSDQRSRFTAPSMYWLTHCLAGIKARYSPGVGDVASDRRSSEYTVPPPKTDVIHTVTADNFGRRQHANCDWTLPALCVWRPFEATALHTRNRLSLATSPPRDE